MRRCTLLEPPMRWTPDLNELLRVGIANSGVIISFAVQQSRSADKLLYAKFLCHLSIYLRDDGIIVKGKIMKGIINDNIADMLNLRPLDEVLKEQGVDVYPDPPPEEINEDEHLAKAINHLNTLKAKMEMVEGTDHSDTMDVVHQEVMQHARDLMTYGFNLDHPRARGIFEIAASMYGHAITSKNLKRDAQLKAMKLALDKRRVDLEEKRTNHAVGQLEMSETTLGDAGVVVADRNELLRKMRDESNDQ